MAISTVEISQTRDSKSKLHVLYCVAPAQFVSSHLFRLIIWKTVSLLPWALNMTVGVSHIHYKKERGICCPQLYPTTRHSFLIHSYTTRTRASKSPLPVPAHIPDVQSSTYEDHHLLIGPENDTCKWQREGGLLTAQQVFMNLQHKTQSYFWHLPDNKSTKPLVGVLFSNIDTQTRSLNLKKIRVSSRCSVLTVTTYCI